MPLRYGEYCKTWNFQEYVWALGAKNQAVHISKFLGFVNNHVPEYGPTLHKNFGRQRVEGLRWSTFFRAIFRMTKIRTLNYPTSITWRGSYHLTNSNGGGLKNKGSSNKVLLLLLRMQFTKSKENHFFLPSNDKISKISHIKFVQNLD